MITPLIFSLIFNISLLHSAAESTDVCHSANELEMYHLINQAREKEGLPGVALSSSLSKVAEMHVKDLQENEPFDKQCNPHSWSNKGTWKECCYREDHSNPECMWKKPSEITDYKGDGYEIVAFWKSGADPNLEISPETALRLWLESSGHSNVIFNKRTFKQVEWKAVGVGIYRNYAAVWFGVEEDAAPPLQQCSN